VGCRPRLRGALDASRLRLLRRPVGRRREANRRAMVGSRTVRSLAQYLELQNGELITLLLEKHRLYAGAVSEAVRYRTGLLTALVQSLDAGGEAQLSALLDEIARTSGDLRNRVSPRYRYDERFADLQQCLQLDGYLIADNRLIPLDPSIVGSPPLEDDLTRELANSGLPSASDVIQKLNDSAQSFRVPTPNYNASLNDARIALQTLATSIADARVSAHPGPFEQSKWGSVIAYLRSTGFITEEEERGLVGVFGFVSPGSHRPLGLSEAEFARLGRSFVAGMCWFLVKRYRANP